MVTIIYSATIVFTILAIVGRVHTNWLVTKNTRLINEFQKARTPAEKAKAFEKLLMFGEKHLKASSINSIFALVLDYFHNHRPQ